MQFQSMLLRNSRWKIWEPLLLAVLIGVPLAMGKFALVNEVVITALFALSLDLILGYAGIVSLGHAAFFGFGAYTAALFAKHVHPDPLVGLAVATAAATVLGAAASATIIRGSDLTRLMVTIGVGLLMFELANKLEFTGGADGLQGVIMGPVLGRFEFDLEGRTAAWYSIVIAFVFLVLLRRIVNSPLPAGCWRRPPVSRRSTCSSSIARPTSC